MCLYKLYSNIFAYFLSIFLLLIITDNVDDNRDTD